MCGIAGIVSVSGEPLTSRTEAALAVMSQSLVHRGPDDQGRWISDDRQVALAHRRLAIVDLSPRGRNPMFWGTDGRLAITYNGEIYNFRELRNELEREGCRFQSETDTEVVLAAYDRWGVDAVRRFVGMFAFALWDAPRRRLWIVRDRFGKKPLYYARHQHTLRFGSELKALTADDAIPIEVDAAALRMYFRYGYVPAPLSILRAVRKLEPAHYLLCEGGRVTSTRYWDPLDYATPRKLTDADAEAELESLLGTAVRQREIADVPLGAFLSGGIDSSLIVALMQEHASRPVRTFTIRFDDPEYNEAHHAAAVARHLHTEHHEDTCDERAMLALVERLPTMFDEPFGDSSAIPTYLVSQAARKHVTVALSGDGGDELFFGYPRYRYHKSAAWALAMPAPLRHGAAAIAQRMPNRRLRRAGEVLRSVDRDSYAPFLTWCSADDVRQLTGADSDVPPLYADMLRRSAEVSRELRPSLLDLALYLPDDILTKVDRASMAVSLEVRAPLLDHRVAEFALGLPLDMKRRDGSMKWLLRQLLYKRVPRELIDRPKMGFGVPLPQWLRGPLRAQMDEYCAGDDLERIGVDPRPVRSIWRRFLAGGPDRSTLLWQTYVLVAWSRSVRERVPVGAAQGSSRLTR